MSDRLPAVPEEPVTPLSDQQQTALPPTNSWSQLAPEPEQGVDWRRYVAAILRHKWLVLLLALAGAGAGFAVSRFVVLEYRADAATWIEATAVSDRGPIRPGQLLETYGWVELLRSFVVLDHVVEELGLYLTPENEDDSGLFDSFELTGAPLAPGSYVAAVDETGSRIDLLTAEGILIESVLPGDTLGLRLGFSWLLPPTVLQPGVEVEFSVTTPRQAAGELRSRIQPQIDREGNFLRVSLVGANPQLIAATVNAVVRRHVELAAELKKEKLVQVAEILQLQLQDADLSLRSAEDVLESFRIETVTLPSERSGPVAGGIEQTRGPVFQRFFEMRVERDELRQERAALERVLQTPADAGLSTDALEVINAVRGSSELTQALTQLTDRQASLRALAFRYTEEHRLVQQARDEVHEMESVTIPALLDDLVREMRSREVDLDARLSTASDELRQIPPRMIREARFVRDRDAAEAMFTDLQRRFEVARLEEATAVPDLRVLDLAVVPQRPLSDQRPRFIVMGLAAGLGLGLVGAILLDRVDRRVRYPDQVTAELGLTLLGVIPRLKTATNGSGGPGTSAVVEALRGVRLNLVHAYGTAGPLVLTVSSPGPGDGKSFVAANLALAFSDAGHRTILIDGDARRGALHRVLGQARKPGLTDILADNVGHDEAIQSTDYAALSFVGCGTRTSGAPELLSSAAMSHLITSLRSRFGVIIVDSPPLGAGVDAFALGTVTGNLMLVLRLGSTDRELAGAKLDVLDRLPVRVLGAVLNDVREGAGSAYRYYRYHSYYLPGYEHEDETDRKKTALIGGKG